MSSVLAIKKKKCCCSVNTFEGHKKKERWVKCIKTGGKLGGCLLQGSLKNKKNIKNLPLQVPPQMLGKTMDVSKYLIYCNTVMYCTNYVHSFFSK